MRWKWKPKAANGHDRDSSNDCKPKLTARAEFSPLSGQRMVHRRNRPMQLRTVAGVVELKAAYGQDPADRHWGCPVRELWGLTTHQQLSLALEDKLAFTITATASYEEAAARVWFLVGEGKRRFLRFKMYKFSQIAKYGWDEAPSDRSEGS